MDFRRRQEAEKLQPDIYMWRSVSYLSNKIYDNSSATVCTCTILADRIDFLSIFSFAVQFLLAIINQDEFRN